MAFNIKKPKHLLGLIILLVTFYILFIDPVLSYVDIFSYMQIINSTGATIASILITLIYVYLFLTPFLWYFFVDGYKFKDMLGALKLQSQGADMAFLWGVAAALFMFVVSISIVFVETMVTGADEESVTMISNMVSNLTIFSIALIIFQTIGTEIYFRGFLIGKIDSFGGKNLAIMITAILYSLVHLYYGALYTILVPIILGIILGYVVMRTKNLYSAITAQMFFNVTIFILYSASQSLLASFS